MSKFELDKTQNFLDEIEEKVTEYCIECILYHYQVSELKELSITQIQEVAEHIEEDENRYADIIMLGLRNCVQLWENEHDEDVYGY